MTDASIALLRDTACVFSGAEMGLHCAFVSELPSLCSSESVLKGQRRLFRYNSGKSFFPREAVAEHIFAPFSSLWAYGVRVSLLLAGRGRGEGALCKGLQLGCRASFRWRRSPRAASRRMSPRAIALLKRKVPPWTSCGQGCLPLGRDLPPRVLEHRLLGEALGQ